MIDLINDLAHEAINRVRIYIEQGGIMPSVFGNDDRKARNSCCEYGSFLSAIIHGVRRDQVRTNL
jgi:hypothetical protein